MKITLSVAILLFLNFSLFAQNGPVDHMNALSSRFDQISKDTWDYIKLASRGRSANRVEKRRVELANTLRTAKNEVGRVKPFEGDGSLKQAYFNYLSLSYLVINEDFKRIVDLERIAEESYDDMEAYLLTKERVNSKMDSAHEVLRTAYRTFAANNGVNLTEGEQSRISKKLENAGEISHYTNKVYLVFFKSNWYESNMIKAQTENRIGDVEQSRQTLETISAEGKGDLKSILAYKGDNSLKMACLRMLDFYHNEAKIHMPKQVDFFAATERMETIRKNFESKKKNAITQEDIDHYNKEIDAYNNAINDYNKTNEFLNSQRKKLHDQFNDAMDDFYKKFL